MVTIIHKRYTRGMETTDDLFEQAKTILTNNDHDGKHTIPADGLYPHQWLWDSCFIAIGLRHYDVKRAQTELLNLLKGQWANGMVPSMILNGKFTLRQDRNFWRSQVSPYAPDKVATSGITQPPVLAEAIVRVGKQLGKVERRSWYQKSFAQLVAYHQWLYTDRDPHNEGLVLLIHPWESGLDNTPPWIAELHEHRLPFWIRAMHGLKLDNVFTLFRRDVHFMGSAVEQRMPTVDIFALYSMQRRLRRKAYNIDRILTHSMLTIEDLTFNCILVRANHYLRHIARTIGKELPEDLQKHMHRTEQALETLWDDQSEQYYSRNYVTHKLIKIPSIAGLMPLYAGTVSKERAAHLVKLLTSKPYNPRYPVPSVPTDSAWFHPHLFWQGPTWLNTNWLIIEGLRHYDYNKEADHIAEQSLAMVRKGGFYEYFSPLDASPAGAANFSWTAALTIDLLNHNNKQR